MTSKRAVDRVLAEVERASCPDMERFVGMREAELRALVKDMDRELSATVKEARQEVEARDTRISYLWLAVAFLGCTVAYLVIRS